MTREIIYSCRDWEWAYRRDLEVSRRCECSRAASSCAQVGRTADNSSLLSGIAPDNCDKLQHTHTHVSRVTVTCWLNTNMRCFAAIPPSKWHCFSLEICQNLEDGVLTKHGALTAKLPIHFETLGRAYKVKGVSPPRRLAKPWFQQRSCAKTFPPNGCFVALALLKNQI